MNIAVVVGTFPSLSETFILNQITGLIDRGHQVDIYAQEIGMVSKIHADVKRYELMARVQLFPKASEGKFSRYLESLGALVKASLGRPDLLFKALNFGRYGTTLLAWRLFYSPMLSRQPKRYDIIHCHFMFNGPLGLIIRQFNNPQAKVVTTFHGCDANIKIAAIDQKKYGWLFQHCDLFTSNTSFTAKQAVLLGCPAEKMVKLPVGLDISKYHYREARFPRDGAVKILTVARLVEKKGLEYSIQAVATLAKRYPKLEYLIAGDGPLKPSLKALCIDLGVDKNVQFLDWMDQDEVRDLYRTSHLFVLASVTAANGDKEGQGLVLQEAQATGLPVVSTLHNGIPDGVLDGKSGFLVPERDVEGLAQKLDYLIQNPQIWPEMSRAGRDFIETKFNIEMLNHHLEDMFKNLSRDEPVQGTDPLFSQPLSLPA